MGDQLRSQPPPDAVMRVLNPVMRVVVPTPGGRAMPGVALLRFTGRRSGRAFQVPVAIFDDEGAEVVLSDSGWAANFRDGRDAVVVRRGRARPAHGTLVTDPGYVGPLVRRLLKTRTGALMLGLKGNDEPTDDEVAAVRHAIVLRPR